MDIVETLYKIDEACGVIDGASECISCPLLKKNLCLTEKFVGLHELATGMGDDDWEEFFEYAERVGSECASDYDEWCSYEDCMRKEEAEERMIDGLHS